MQMHGTTEWGGGKQTLPVEWHDCSWQPAIRQVTRINRRQLDAIKPLPRTGLLPHPSRRKNLLKPMRKNSSGPRRFEMGFTLVELLTVIAIIAILAAMLFPVLSHVKQTAYISQARIQVNDIATAIQGYDSAYGRFPVSTNTQGLAASAGTDVTYCGVYTNAGSQTWPPASVAGSTIVQGNSEVISILMDYTNYPDGSINTPSPNANYQKNPQKTQFLNAKLSGWDPQNGPGTTPLAGVGSDLNYRDPWGNPYIISMDLNYDGQCVDAFYGQPAVSQNGTQGYNGLILNSQSGLYQFHGTVMVWSMGPSGPSSGSPSSFDNGQANDAANKGHILSWK